MPRYMLLIYAPAESGPSPSPEEMAAQHERWNDYTQSLVDAGAMLGGDQLHDVESATTVRGGDGETQIIDGPFAETKEFLAGYYMLECPDLDAALAHAGRAPIIGSGAVEVRPIVEREAVAAGAGEEQAQA